MSDHLEDINDREELEDDGLFEHHKFLVDPGQSLMRIDKFLSNRLNNVSRSKIQAAAEASNILVNDNPVKASYNIKPDDEIRIVMEYPKRELKIIPEDIPLDIIFEDDQLIVLNKPAGLVVHPGHGNYTGTLVNALAWHYRNLPLFNS